MRSDSLVVAVRIIVIMLLVSKIISLQRTVLRNNRGVTVSALVHNKQIVARRRPLVLLASPLSGTEVKSQQQQQQQRHFQSSSSSSSTSDEDDSNTSSSTIHNNNNNNEDKDIASLLIPPVFAAEDYTLYGGTTTATTATATTTTNSDHHHLSPLFQDGVQTQLKLHQRIVTFGDVHGDLSKLIQFLVTAKVMKLPASISEALLNPTWCGGSTICIQVGDILDRGANELACIRLLSKLSQQAYDSGGALICLLGNHEALNAVGLFQYADPSGNLEFELAIGRAIDQTMGSSRWRIQYAGNEPSRWLACEPGGLLSSTLFQNMKLACQVGRSVFVHAGLTKDHLIQLGGIAKMNKDTANWFAASHYNKINNGGNFDSVQQVFQAAQERSKVQSKTLPQCLGGGIGSPSPVWMREYSSPSDRDGTTKHLRMISDALGYLEDAQRMIMGHTPQSYINAALQGKAWRVDVGASRGVKDGTPEVLEIIHGGGDTNGDTDDIHILTIDGNRVPGKERHVSNYNDIF